VNPSGRRVGQDDPPAEDETSDGQPALALQPIRDPQPAMAPTEGADLDVLVAPELAVPLDSAVLDARETADASLLGRDVRGRIEASEMTSPVLCDVTGSAPAPRARVSSV
jgi:hypothetical protein